MILEVVKGGTPQEIKADDVIIYGINGKPISGRTPNQRKLVEAFTRNDLTSPSGRPAPARPTWP